MMSLVMTSWQALSILVLMVHLLLMMMSFFIRVLLMIWWLVRILLVIPLGLALEVDDIIGQVGDHHHLYGHLALGHG